MIQTIIRLGLVIISWSSLVFLPKKAFNKFLPVSLFTSLLVLIVSVLAIRYKFWVVKGGMSKKVINDLSFIYGPFFAGTLWIFHLTFGHFKRYLIVNTIMNASLSYPFNSLFEKLKVYKLINFKPIHVFLSYMSFSFIIYGYQLLLNWSNK